MPTAPSTVTIGTLKLQVRRGEAAAQRVTVSQRWDATLRRSSASAPAVPDGLADRLRAITVEADGTPRTMSRAELYRRAADGPLDEAYLTVMAWGLGTTGRWNRLTPYVRKALWGPYQRLQASRDAVNGGTDLRGLWTAHMRSAPQGLGAVSFGSKWLHAVGWGQVVGTQPLVYDQVVADGLRRLAGLSQFPAANGRTAIVREGWVAWCELAESVAAPAGVGADDVEHALFRHTQNAARTA